MISLGLSAVVLSNSNLKEVLKSELVKIVFVSPELLKQNSTIQALLNARNEFVIKCIGQGSGLRLKDQLSFFFNLKYTLLNEIIHKDKGSYTKLKYPF